MRDSSATIHRYTYLYGGRGPWPQPNPQRPLGEAAIVLNVPEAEQRHFDRTVGLRFKLTLILGIPRAMWEAATHAVTEPIPDDWFAAVLTESAYSKFLVPLDGGDDEKPFAPVIAGDPSRTFYKMDFTAMRYVEPYQGMHVAPTMVLVEEIAGQDPSIPVEHRAKRPVAILVNDTLLLEPTAAEQGAWDLAKVFVLQGAAYGMLFTEHPNLHFPFDAINAITKTWLPQQHPIYQMLIPHLEFQLSLNLGVLESRQSVITNKRETFYAPFTANMSDGLLELFVAGYAGEEGRSGYPTYDFQTRPKKVYSHYGSFLDAYYEACLPFAEKVAEVALEPEWRDVTAQWAEYIAPWVKGFPTREEIVDAATLEATLARIVWDLTIGHGADHQVFSYDVTPERKFLRLRLPPPAGKNAPPVPMRELARWVDRFKMRIAHRTFFEPITRTRLLDVKYPFVDSRLDAAGHAFLASLRQTEASLSARGIRIYMPIENAPASIQF